jgi:hypothetical protein
MVTRKLVMRSLVVAGVASLMLVPAGGAVGAARGAATPAKVPPGSTGVFYHVSAVPHSADVWATGLLGSSNSARSKGFVAHRHDGRWQLEKLGAGVGEGSATVLVVAAASSTLVWAAGASSSGPWLGRWHGKAFTPVTLPGPAPSGTFSALAASSPRNAWAAGNLEASSGPVAEHWNGNKWSAVPLPTAADVVSIAATSTNNAWAISGQDVLHWNRRSWAINKTLPGNVLLVSISASSSKDAYAVGQNQTAGASYIMHFNGRKWSPISSPSLFQASQLTGVTMHGTSAWAVGSAGTGILHTSGGKWRAQSTHDVGGSGFADVSAEAANRVYEVGERGNYPTFRLSIALYNGHVWKALPARV